MSLVHRGTRHCCRWMLLSSLGSSESQVADKVQQKRVGSREEARETPRHVKSHIRPFPDTGYVSASGQTPDSFIALRRIPQATGNTTDGRTNHLVPDGAAPSRNGREPLKLRRLELEHPVTENAQHRIVKRALRCALNCWQFIQFSSGGAQGIIAMDALRLKSAFSSPISSFKRESYCCPKATNAIRAKSCSPRSFPSSLQFSPGLNFNVLEERRTCDGRRSRRSVAFELRVSMQGPSSSSSIEEEVAPSISTSGSNARISPSSSTSGIEIETRMWKWRAYNIRYQAAGKAGPALVLIHGFGANCDHWRKNIPELARSHQVYAIDLLGYGYSDKPDPRGHPPNTLYTFETWGQQVLDFCDEIVNDSAFLICNSVGGVVGLQSALMQPQTVRGVLLLNISLRLLHIKKQSRFAKPFVKALQNVLRNTNLGQRFFKSVATRASVKRILCQCYHDEGAVTDELVDKILKPGLLPGAVDVFLDFICYSGGPLPEEMLPEVKCPVLIGWGDKDPWEKVALGRAYANFSTVEDFIVLPNVGHCPQDEAPHLVNPLVADFVQRHSF